MPCPQITSHDSSFPNHVILQMIIQRKMVQRSIHSYTLATGHHNWTGLSCLYEFILAHERSLLISKRTPHSYTNILHFMYTRGSNGLDSNQMVVASCTINLHTNLHPLSSYHTLVCTKTNQIIHILHILYN